MALWLEGDVAAPLTVRIVGVGSSSAPAALANPSGAVGMAATGTLVVGTIAVP